MRRSIGSSAAAITSPFLEAHDLAVRFSEPTEDYDRQHQTIHTEDGRCYGDIIEFVDLSYLARLTALNVAVIRELASAPPALPACRLQAHSAMIRMSLAAHSRRCRLSHSLAARGRFVWTDWRDVSASATLLDLSHVSIDDHLF